MFKSFGNFGLVGQAARVAEAKIVQPVARTAVQKAVGAAAPRVLTGGGLNAWEGRILSRVTESHETMYRVWGGGSGRVGQWLTPFKPDFAQAAREALALPPGKTASFVSEVTVPAGTRLPIGVASRAFGQRGGGMQVQLLDRIAPELFGEGQPLTPMLEAAFK